MSAIYDAAIIWDNIVLCAYTRPFYKKLKWGEIGEYLQNEKFSTPKRMLKPSVTFEFLFWIPSNQSDGEL